MFANWFPKRYYFAILLLFSRVIDTVLLRFSPAHFAAKWIALCWNSKTAIRVTSAISISAKLPMVKVQNSILNWFQRMKKWLVPTSWWWPCFRSSFMNIWLNSSRQTTKFAVSIRRMHTRTFVYTGSDVFNSKSLLLFSSAARIFNICAASCGRFGLQWPDYGRSWGKT